jgi:hypothetical protein
MSSCPASGWLHQLVRRQASRESLSNQPQSAKREEHPVVRKIVTLINVDFSDVLAVRVATNKWTKPAMCVISDGRTENVEAPNESTDVKRKHDTANRAKKP